MKTNHTPGPWNFKRVNAELLEIGCDEYPVATINHDPLDANDMEANAALIASAPDLLAALEQALHDIDNPEPMPPRHMSTLSLATQQTIRTALAKARRR